jgi:hypothetical protein
MAHRALQEGAAGVDMGRNIFQAVAPAAMDQAVRAVVHNGETPAKAYDHYRSLKGVGVNVGLSFVGQGGKTAADAHPGTCDEALVSLWGGQLYPCNDYVKACASHRQTCLRPE